MPEMKILQAADYVILLGYFAIIIFIGVHFQKYIREAKDYFAVGAMMFLSGFLLRALKIGRHSPANG